MPAPVLIVDSRNRLKYVNARAEHFFGQQIKDMLGAEFQYPLEPEKTTRASVRFEDGRRLAVEFDAVKTRWDGAPSLLVTMREAV